MTENGRNTAATAVRTADNFNLIHMNHNVRKCTFGYVRPVKSQISVCILAFSIAKDAKLRQVATKDSIRLCGCADTQTDFSLRSEHMSHVAVLFCFFWYFLYYNSKVIPQYWVQEAVDSQL